MPVELLLLLLLLNNQLSSYWITVLYKNLMFMTYF